MLRRGYRKGEWLVTDDESGLTEYASNTTEDYYGKRINKNYADYAHPQDFIRARDDPRPLPFLRPNDPFQVPCAFYPRFVGATSVPSSTIRDGSPAGHLYDPPIPEMVISCSFTVR